jgi:hypothetical protein
MHPDRRQRLEALPGWSWTVRLDQWEEGFAHLKQLSDREGHCFVSENHKTDAGYRLDSWVRNQRAAMKTMGPDRRRRLEALPGWSWDKTFADNRWEHGFAHLKQFSDREGHCRVASYLDADNGYRLGQWVSVQRATKHRLDLDRQRRLEALPGWSWDVFSARWEEGFTHLKQFLEREGHCRVIRRYKTEDGYQLGRWVGTQITNKSTMDPDRRQRLEALPGWSWAVFSDRWEKSFSHLKEFAERERHCRVPRHHETDDGFVLGYWASDQRNAKDTMDLDRRRRLEALPGWVWKAEK